MSSFYIVTRVKNFHYSNIELLFQLFRIKNLKSMADETDVKIQGDHMLAPSKVNKKSL